MDKKALFDGKIAISSTKLGGQGFIIFSGNLGVVFTDYMLCGGRRPPLRIICPAKTTVSKKNDEPLVARFWRGNGAFSSGNANMDTLYKKHQLKTKRKFDFQFKKRKNAFWPRFEIKFSHFPSPPIFSAIYQILLPPLLHHHYLVKTQNQLFFYFFFSFFTKSQKNNKSLGKFLFIFNWAGCRGYEGAKG